MTDNAKELLALADELVGLRFSSEVAINEDVADKLDQISGHLRRLSARQQASVEEVEGFIYMRHHWPSIEIAHALLAKFDIFQKVEG